MLMLYEHIIYFKLQMIIDHLDSDQIHIDSETKYNFDELYSILDWETYLTGEFENVLEDLNLFDGNNLTKINKKYLTESFKQVNFNYITKHFRLILKNLKNKLKGKTMIVDEKQ